MIFKSVLLAVALALPQTPAPTAAPIPKVVAVAPEDKVSLENYQLKLENIQLKAYQIQSRYNQNIKDLQDQFAAEEKLFQAAQDEVKKKLKIPAASTYDASKFSFTLPSASKLPEEPAPQKVK